MEDTDLKWRTASYSSNGGATCVEVAGHDGAVLVRDTTNRSGSVLAVPAGAWRAFTAGVRGGEPGRLP